MLALDPPSDLQISPAFNVAELFEDHPLDDGLVVIEDEETHLLQKTAKMQGHRSKSFYFQYCVCLLAYLLYYLLPIIYYVFVMLICLLV